MRDRKYPVIGDNGQQVGKSIDLRNAALFLKTCTEITVSSFTDHTERDVWLLIKFGEGNLSWNMNREIQYERDRDKLDDVNSGPEQPLEVTFEGKATFVLSASEEPHTIHEITSGYNFETGVMQFAGTPEPWLAKYGCPPYACELEYHQIPQLECPTIDADGEAMLFRYFRASSVGWDQSSKRVSIRGNCDVLVPRVMRPAYATLYATELGEGSLKVTDLVPFTAASWYADDRDPDAPEEGGTPALYTT